jgi:hypothetical protein
MQVVRVSLLARGASQRHFPYAPIVTTWKLRGNSTLVLVRGGFWCWRLFDKRQGEAWPLLPGLQISGDHQGKPAGGSQILSIGQNGLSIVS